MKLILIILSLMISTVTFAQSKADMTKMLQEFKKNGMFSEAQLAAAQKQLDEMSDEDLDAIKSKAAESMNDPKVQEKIKELEKDK